MTSEIRQIRGDENFVGFATGNRTVDRWIHSHARLASLYGTAVVYGLYDGGEVVGIYTLSACSLDRDAVESSWLRRNTPRQIPAFLLGMLGVKSIEQGKGYGSRLLQDAIERSLQAAEVIGAKVLLVDPADESIQGFYLRFGFRELGESGRLFLPLRLKA